jgi:hypothetical protein
VLFQIALAHTTRKYEEVEVPPREKVVNRAVAQMARNSMAKFQQGSTVVKPQNISCMENMALSISQFSEFGDNSAMSNSNH